MTVVSMQIMEQIRTPLLEKIKVLIIDNEALIKRSNRYALEIDNLTAELAEAKSADISSREMVYLDGTGWGINALRKAIIRSDDCECEKLRNELEEAKSECNLWKAENSNAQRSIGIHLNRITSLEKENAAIRMAQAHGRRNDIFMLSQSYT